MVLFIYFFHFSLFLQKSFTFLQVLDFNAASAFMQAVMSFFPGSLFLSNSLPRCLSTATFSAVVHGRFFAAWLTWGLPVQSIFLVVSTPVTPSCLRLWPVSKQKYMMFQQIRLAFIKSIKSKQLICKMITASEFPWHFFDMINDMLACVIYCGQYKSIGPTLDFFFLHYCLCHA